MRADILRVTQYFSKPRSGEEKCVQRVKCPRVLSTKTPNKRFIIPVHFVFASSSLSKKKNKQKKNSQTGIVQCITLAYFAHSLALLRYNDNIGMINKDIIKVLDSSTISRL